MTSDPDPDNYGRGMRRPRPTQRAQEVQQAQEADVVKTDIKPEPEPVLTVAIPSVTSRPIIPQPLSATLPPISPRAPSPIHHSPATVMAPRQNREGAADLTDADMALPDQASDQNLQPPKDEPSSNTIATSIETEGKDDHTLAAQDATTLLPDDVSASLQLKPFSSHPPTRDDSPSVAETQKDTASAQTIQPSHRVTKSAQPQRSHKKKAPSKRVRTETQPKKKHAPPARDSFQNFKTQDRELQPHALHIYHWEHPIPTDFLNLPDSLKAAKARADVEGAELDTDPELDDWHEFCGLPPTVYGLTLKQSIGLNFISRAKRAFRAGRSWTHFEQEELSIDSRAGAKAFKDPYQRQIALESSLSNTLRLNVFHQLKVRLCHEIWLQPYPESSSVAASLRDSVISPTDSTPAVRHGTALDAAIQRLATLPDRLTSLASTNDGSAEQQQIRTKPELPGRDRELHQPEGPLVRISQTNMQHLGMSWMDRLLGGGLDMSTSEEEREVEDE